MVSDPWDSNGDSLPGIQDGSEIGRRFGRYYGKPGRRSLFEGCLVCLAGTFAQGKLRRFPDRRPRVRVPPTDLQERPEVVRPGEGIGAAPFPWLSVLPV